MRIVASVAHHHVAIENAPPVIDAKARRRLKGLHHSEQRLRDYPDSLA
jgi:hypothetical protein